MLSSSLPKSSSIRGLRKVYLPPKFSVEKSFSYLSRHIPGHFPPKFSVSWGRDLSVFWTQEWDLRGFSISSHDFKISAYSRFLIFAGSKTTLTSKQREEAALISEKPGVDRLETSTSYLVNYSENGIIIGMDARSHKLPDRQNGIRKTENRFFWGIYAMNLDSWRSRKKFLRSFLAYTDKKTGIAVFEWWMNRTDSSAWFSAKCLLYYAQPQRRRAAMPKMMPPDLIRSSNKWRVCLRDAKQSPPHLEVMGFEWIMHLCFILRIIHLTSREGKWAHGGNGEWG